MNNRQFNGNNIYSHNYNNQANNKKNESNPFNQIKQGISHNGQQFPNSKRSFSDKKYVSNNNMQNTQNEIKQKYKLDSQNFNYELYGSNSNNINNEQLNQILKDKEQEIEKLRKENSKLKKDLEKLMALNKDLIHLKGSISISSEGKYIFNKNNNVNNNNKLEDIERREKELNEREKEFNNKINFLEDKENQIEKEKNELIKLKQKYDQLNLRGQSSLQPSINGSQIVMKPLDLYKSPTLVGLNNIGALYIMNPTLQCLSQTKGLTNFFLKDKNKEKIIKNNIALNNKNAFQLSPLYLELIQNLWNENGPKSFSPNKIKNIIEQMNPSFKAGQAINIKGFIDFILMKLHQELFQNKNSNQNIVSFDPYNMQESLMKSHNDFQKQCSIITDLFTGFNEETNECIYCKNYFNSMGQNHPIRYSYKVFNCLAFPLEEIKKMKDNLFKSQNMNISNDRVSLYDCFSYNQNSFTCKGQPNKLCQKCNQISDSILTTKIYISPNILILILNRGKGNIYNCKLDFSETIDITQFVVQKEVPQIKYNLYGVITQISQSGMGSKFIASCKSPIDNKWYRYDDNIVNPISNIQKEVIDLGVPFVLFYEKLN